MELRACPLRLPWKSGRSTCRDRSEEERSWKPSIAVVALLFVLFVVLGVYATVKVVGAAKRGVDRTITQARRTVEDTTLRAKSFGPAGPGGRAGRSCG